MPDNVTYHFGIDVKKIKFDAIFNTLKGKGVSMKVIFMVILLAGISSNLMAADYYNAKFSTTGDSYSSATQVATSRDVCHRATGNLSSCTNRVHCGGETVWPTASQMKKFKAWTGKSKINVMWFTDGSKTVCKMR